MCFELCIAYSQTKSHNGFIFDTDLPLYMFILVTDFENLIVLFSTLSMNCSSMCSSLRDLWLNAEYNGRPVITEGMNLFRAVQLMFCGADIRHSA